MAEGMLFSGELTDISKMPTIKASDIAVIKNEMKHIKTGVDEIRKTLKVDYVTREEFNPVKRIAYGAVAFVVTAFMAALTALVFTK